MHLPVIRSIVASAALVAAGACTYIFVVAAPMTPQTIALPGATVEPTIGSAGLPPGNRLDSTNSQVTVIETAESLGGPGMDYECGSRTFCFGMSGGSAHLYDGTTWEPVALPDGLTDGEVAMCSDAACAVNFHAVGGLRVFDGRGWSGPVFNAFTEVTQCAPSGVHCWTSGTYNGVDGDWRYDEGVGWSEILGGFPAEALVWFDGTNWVPTTIDPTVLTRSEATCLAEDFCFGANEYGAFTTVNGSITPILWDETYMDLGYDDIACSAPRRCVLRSRSGQLVFSDSLGEYLSDDEELVHLSVSPSAIHCAVDGFCYAETYAVGYDLVLDLGAP